jgi:Domain of unknown function (DUF4350)
MRSGRRTLVLAVLAVLAAMAALVAVAGKGGEAQGSSVSRGPSGWLAARKYLEARGAQVTLWREPLDRFSAGGALVVAFPWQHGSLQAGADALEAHLRRGGDVVLAYSGTSNNGWEQVVLTELGVASEEVRKAPLSPFAWRKFIREEWDLVPEGPHPLSLSRERERERGEQQRMSSPGSPLPLAGEGPGVRVWAPRHMPELPQDPEVLYRTPGGRPAVLRWRQYKGSIWLLPADALSNARLGEAGNAGLLELLLARLGPRWTFDEYNHGLARIEAEGDEAFGRILDLVLIHLAILYALAVVTLSRRFGPPWQDQPVVTGSVGSFLLGLGTLHHRLRHHREAAERLLERTRELAPDLVIPEDLARQASSAGPHDLVEVARALVQLRRIPQTRRSARPTSSGSGDRT